MGVSLCGDSPKNGCLPLALPLIPTSSVFPFKNDTHVHTVGLNLQTPPPFFRDVGEWTRGVLPTPLLQARCHPRYPTKWISRSEADFNYPPFLGYHVDPLLKKSGIFTLKNSFFSKAYPRHKWVFGVGRSCMAIAQWMKIDILPSSDRTFLKIFPSDPARKGDAKIPCRPQGASPKIKSWMYDLCE